LKIGVFGLGSMGYGMATSLIRSGHQVYGADINPASVTRLRADGGSTKDAMSVVADLAAVAIVVLNAAQAEDVLFGEGGVVAGLAAEAVVILCVTVAPDYARSVAKRCAGTSWMLENRAPHIVEGDYTPRSAVDIWPKDLGIVLDAARTSKFAAPVTAAALQQFLAASGMGLGREDDAAVAKVYARNASLKLPGTDEK
jgi:3-hydroxyisobutyrate dehydrogenase-like beta-hydroxyacid dehydrogenase